MNLHKDEQIFKDAITATSTALNIREVYIEKDYWVTFALKNLSLSEYKEVAIFKGGTSLSKAYNLIERFSEDIDLALEIQDEISGNQIKKLIGKIQKATAGELPELDIKGITSKGSKFRKTVHEYKCIADKDDYGQATDKLLIEVNAFATPTPHSAFNIQSYIGKYLSSTGNLEIIKKYELAPIEVRVLQLERTFTEKILGLIRISHQENHIEELKIKIRHIYDIERILHLGKDVESFLFSPNFFNKIDEVKHDDSSNHEFSGEWIKQPLMSSPLFNNIEETWGKMKETYLTEFKSLVFGYLPSPEEILRGLNTISIRLKEYDKNNPT